MDFIKIGDFYFPILVAITADEQSQGLMNVPAPAPIMVFPFKKAKMRSFWMENTPAPLEILFCRGNKILQIEEGIPLTKKNIVARIASDLVVELPRGLVDSLGIKIGQNIEIQYSVGKVCKLYEWWYGI